MTGSILQARRTGAPALACRANPSRLKRLGPQGGHNSSDVARPTGGASANCRANRYQPPAQSRGGRLFLRRSLRFSSRHWSVDIAAMKSGKKAMMMKPAFVTTLSLAGP